uniref:Capsid protein n=1 Tax=Torque teno virus TaxID=68887 RepID=A0A1B1FDK2_9VIRU|nr:ORF1 [Torque teno virus]
MPYFWRRPYYNRWKRWRRPGYWNRRRRLRAAFRRPRRRRTRYRVRRLITKKLKTIKLKEWQPKTIRRCSIIGHIPLVLCGRGRQVNNFMQYFDSYVPIDKPGGGGWSSIVFNLGGLYQQFQKLLNWWTHDNDGLPLVRFLGSDWKFYRSWDTDYIVTAQTCPPMTDTEFKHLNSHPYRQLMNKHPIVVPNLVRHQYKKQYVRKHFPPPSLLQNKWYFQQDLCNTNLLMLTTSACSLDQFWMPNNELSNNITFYCLNTNIFANPNFLQNGTRGYNPKSTMILWGEGNGHTTQPQSFQQLIYLGNLKTFKLGNTQSQGTPPGTETNWGNPFHGDHGSQDTKIWYSTQMPHTFTDPTQGKITLAEPLFQQCRYNPLKDTGLGNVVFFKSVSISTGNIWDTPKDPTVVISGFPLWLIFWGWTDWLQKLKPIQQIDLNYYIVILSDFIKPKMHGYVPLDHHFVFPQQDTLDDNDKQHWHPRFKYQQETLNQIGISGPCTPKVNKSQSIQVNALYKFRFKWGGCPAPMQNIKDPCQQPKFPVPGNLLQTIQIHDPAEDKQTTLSDFDERRQQLTTTATKRIKKAKDCKTPLFPDLLNPQIIYEETSETSSEEEEETQQTFSQQLIRIKRQRLYLLRKLNQLASHA